MRINAKRILTWTGGQRGQGDEQRRYHQRQITDIDQACKIDIGLIFAAKVIESNEQFLNHHGDVTNINYPGAINIANTASFAAGPGGAVPSG